MIGVEILAAQEVIVSYAWNWSAYFITIVATMIILGLVGLFYGEYELKNFFIGLAIGATVGIMVGVLPASFTKPGEYETQYKITISDKVFMNDLLERYEIIDQEGKIYTVRERVVEDEK